MNTSDTVVVGRVGKSHGLDGSFVVENASEAPERFEVGAELIVEGGFGVFFFVYLRRRARAFRDPMPRPVLRLVKKGV